MIVSSFANHYGAVATDNSVGITLVFDLSAWFRLRLNAREIQIFKHSMLKIAMITYLVSILTFWGGDTRNLEDLFLQRNG